MAISASKIKQVVEKMDKEAKDTKEQYWANTWGVEDKIKNGTAKSVTIKEYKSKAKVYTTCMQMCDDGAGPAHGASTAEIKMKQSTTAFALNKLDEKGRTVGHVYLNADEIPYIVLPEKNGNNIGLGDIGVVYNKQNGKFSYVMFGERGPEGRIGEASVRTLQNLGIPMGGHNDLDIVYVLFPGSRVKCGTQNGTSLPTDVYLDSVAEFYIQEFINANNL